jgi:tape measure domain-containing protein
MPSALQLILGADATPFYKVLGELPPRTAQMMRGIRQQMDTPFAMGRTKGKNTVFNPTQEKDAVREYGEWWDKTLTDQSVRAATRSNEARRLVRQRDQARERASEVANQEKIAADVETASRSIQARRLMRQRRESRERAAEAARENSFFSRMFDGATARFLGVGAAIGAIYRGIQLFGESIQAKIVTQRLENTFAAVTGSTKKAAEQLKILRADADAVGFSYANVGQRIANFKVAAKEAGLSDEMSNKISRSVLKAGVALGLDSSRQAEALLALEQMLSRGSVMSQELRLQWGNAIPGGLNIFAKALGVTNGELLKMVESGTLVSKDVLPKVADQLDKSIPFVRTLAADIEVLKNAWFDLKATMGETLSGDVKLALQDLTILINVAGKLKNLLPESGEKKIGFLERMTLGGRGVGALARMAGGIGVPEPGMSEAESAEHQRNFEARLAKLAAAREKFESDHAVSTEALKLSAIDPKEKDLNTLLLQRIQLMDALAKKADLNKESFEAMAKALEKVNNMIALETSGGGRDRMALELEQIKKEQSELLKKRAEQTKIIEETGKGPTDIFKAVAERDKLDAQLKEANQKRRAKQQEIDIFDKEAAEKERKKKLEKGGVGIPNLSELQRVGGFITGGEQSIISEQRTGNQLLRQIYQVLNKPSFTRPAQRGVNFGGRR